MTVRSRPCVHLHGGEVPPELDGGPDAWFTSDGCQAARLLHQGRRRRQELRIYRYPNTQEGALIWFHDHTLGATRLNVYAGLAGAYLIADPDDTILASCCPSSSRWCIQDRMFDTNGAALLPGRYRRWCALGAQPRAPLLGARVRRRRHRGQRQVLALHGRPAQSATPSC